MANDYYARTYAFAERTKAKGDEVRAEFDAIVSGLDAVQVDTKRAITMPAGTTVELPSFAPSRALKVIGFDAAGNVELQAGVGSFQGNWLTGTDYEVRDIMIDAAGVLDGVNDVYICNTVHTASASLATDLAYWDKMIDVGSVEAARALAETAQAAAEAAATNAGTSETNAAASASTASTQAGIATTQASNAATSAANAATSETNAAASASTATTQATTATTQAGIAATKASEASASAVSAALSEFNINVKWLSPAAADPTLDDNGDPVAAGAAYVNTSSGFIRYYNGSTWSDSVDTAANILTKLLTVDGAGSGLDADTVDGIQGSNIAKLDTENTFTENTNVGGGNNINGFRYLDVKNASTVSATNGAILRLITSNVAGSGTTSLDFVKYKNGTFLLNNNETDAARNLILALGGSTKLGVYDTYINNLTGQLKFPATQLPSTDPNILDDYEEGSFTPTIFGLTTSGSPTYTTRDGQYTKIGDYVHAQVTIVLSSKGGMAGGLRVSGLPFLLKTGTYWVAVNIGYAQGLSIAGAYALGGVGQTTGDFFDLHKWGGTAGSSNLDATEALDSLVIYATMTYKAA